MTLVRSVSAARKATVACLARTGRTVRRVLMGFPVPPAQRVPLGRLGRRVLPALLALTVPMEQMASMGHRVPRVSLGRRVSPVPPVRAARMDTATSRT